MDKQSEDKAAILKLSSYLETEKKNALRSAGPCEHMCLAVTFPAGSLMSPLGFNNNLSTGF